jgi:hypothetical protein
MDKQQAVLVGRHHPALAGGTRFEGDRGMTKLARLGLLPRAGGRLTQFPVQESRLILVVGRQIKPIVWSDLNA